MLYVWYIIHNKSWNIPQDKILLFSQLHNYIMILFYFRKVRFILKHSYVTRMSKNRVLIFCRVATKMKINKIKCKSLNSQYSPSAFFRSLYMNLTTEAIIHNSVNMVYLNKKTEQSKLENRIWCQLDSEVQTNPEQFINYCLKAGVYEGSPKIYLSMTKNEIIYPSAGCLMAN